MSQATAARPAAPAEGSDGLYLAPVVLCGPKGEPTRGGMTLAIDERGIVLRDAVGDDERVLSWHRVTGWQVEAWRPEPGIVGSLVTYRTLQATFYFGVPRTDPGALGARIEQLGRRYVPGGAASPPPTAPAPAPSPLEVRVRRLRPVLVVVLVLVLVVMVTLILLQSAGVVHLPWLGGNGSGGPSGLAPLRAAAS